MRCRVAITLGDPRGIGPEIVEKVLRDPPPGAEYVVVGPDELVRDLPCERIVIGEQGAGSRTRRKKGRSGSVTLRPESQPPTSGTAPRSPLPYAPELAGTLVGLSVEKAASLAMSGAVDAIVTGPAEKRALHLAGYPYPGHTEWLAELAGGVDVAMMLVADRLRVVLITTHIPLSAVPSDLTMERVIKVGRITLHALQEWFGISSPRLAVCALNPHAGEGGLFGDEDRTVLTPAAEALDARGPLPADTVFVRAMRGEADAVLAPYHDVGMTAIKVAGFGRGVNITLGLPFIRTAPDHGTAFDIAGSGTADEGSMREAVKLAVEVVERRAGRLGRSHRAEVT